MRTHAPFVNGKKISERRREGFEEHRQPASCAENTGMVRRFSSVSNMEGGQRNNGTGATFVPGTVVVFNGRMEGDGNAGNFFFPIHSSDTKNMQEVNIRNRSWFPFFVGMRWCMRRLDALICSLPIQIVQPK